MSDSPATDIHADSSFTPREERESHKLGFRDYGWKLLEFVLVTKLGAAVGAVVGERFGGVQGAEIGAMVTGTAAATYEGHKHWKPIKGTQERVEALTPEVLAELNPDSIKQEVALQKEISAGLVEREKLFTASVKRHEPHSIKPRGKAADTLLKEAKDIATKGEFLTRS